MYCIGPPFGKISNSKKLLVRFVRNVINQSSVARGIMSARVVLRRTCTLLTTTGASRPRRCCSSKASLIRSVSDELQSYIQGLGNPNEPVVRLKSPVELDAIFSASGVGFGLENQGNMHTTVTTTHATLCISTINTMQHRNYVWLGLGLVSRSRASHSSAEQMPWETTP